VFISSLSGWIGHPGCGAYAGSKFALEGRHSPNTLFLIQPLTRRSGLVESLWRETTNLGIRTLLIEPGRFRTKLLSSGNMRATPSTIPDYAEFTNGLIDTLNRDSEKQPGDPVKLVEIVLDLVRREGVAEGKEVPFRLPLGADCYEEIKSKVEETLKMLDEWGPVTKSTDVEE
jgi:NAD(P)-dependent dehydrogenase (short-subunit alcohol dehydrogenase family)